MCDRTGQTLDTTLLLYMKDKTSTNNTQPGHIGHRKRLRQRYIKAGIGSLADYEALELLLTYTRSQRDVKPEAKKLIKTFGNLAEVLDSTIDQLLEIEGIGIQSAVLIKLVKDLSTKYLNEKQIYRKTINTPLDVVDYLRTKLGAYKKEAAMTLFLNSQNKIVAEEIISEGTVNYVYVHFRNIFEIALKYNSTAIIYVHNHPEGKIEPSDDDIRHTQHLVETAKTLTIEIHDHIIVNRYAYFSFKEKGLL
ncbi:RadC family protein [Candidatus Magnetomonas plexicatena]|uniref:RadC family protein n=1 Tax=Candidatus Magnetomonas plexicatena TaxID=2552947 RepID=UPI001100AFB3|nr:DNA repair protein RadC [Nitrospirales bacterium LBB_01]